MIRAVALMPPTAKTTSAKALGYHHPPRRTAWMVSPMSQGRAVHGNRITEMRAA